MNTTIERKFFHAYDDTDWVKDCVRWIKIQRGLSACAEEAESKRHWYEEELPTKIMEWAGSVRDDVCGKRSPLMQEITANLDSLTDEQARERYIFSLLSPFGEYVKCTDVGEEIDRIKQLIEEDSEQLAIWREVVETPQGEKEFGMRAIEGLSELIDTNKARVVCKQKEQKALTDVHFSLRGNTEKAFRQIVNFAIYYGVALDAHLLERGLDLLRYEREAGIKLVGKHSEDLLADYLGSEKLVQRYLDALPKLEEQPAGDTRPGEQDKGEGKANGALPEIPNAEKFKAMMRAFVDAGFATDLNDDSRGCLWKWDEDNKGLLDFVCGRFFCGDKVKNGKLVFGSGRMPRKKVAPYFSNIDTENLGNQRNQWKSEQANDQYGFSVLLPSGWEEAEAIITQFIKT